METVGRVQVQAFLKEHTYKTSQHPGHSHQVPVLPQYLTASCSSVTPAPVLGLLNSIQKRRETPEPKLVCLLLLDIRFVTFICVLLKATVRGRCHILFRQRKTAMCGYNGSYCIRVLKHTHIC